MKMWTTVLVCVMLILFLRVDPLLSLDREKEFELIGKMTIRELTPRVKAALEKKYPEEKWETYHFPKYVYISDTVLAGYKIAAKQPQLLAKFPCYCFCDETMNHKNLAYCFLKTGSFLGNFDDHGSNCNVCNGEAMMIFLWNELGVSIPQMQAAVTKIYSRQ